MRVDYSNKFDKKFRKVPIHIKKAFTSRIEIFVENQFHPILNNHKLSGSLKDYSSINVTGDWRALYHVVDGNIEWVEFVNIGTHSELYG